MHFQPILLGFATMLVTSWAQDQLNYDDSINALAYGNVALTQGNSSGTIWLNTSGFAPVQLPNIQINIGLYTLDNLEPLNIIAGLAKIAASKGKWGDIVFLYSAFSMNAYTDHVHTSSEQMQYALWHSVTGDNSSTPDANLINLYANTSSSSYLRTAFQNLKTQDLTARHYASETHVEARSEKRWIKEACSSAHKATTSACRSLISQISGSATWKSGGPRSVCYSGCCISWSANATFQFSNLTNAANYCVSACGTSSVSCEVWGVNLQGTLVDQCLSNRANGCK